MERHHRLAARWLRRFVTAAYSPEFYREMGVRPIYRHPETGRLVVFQSLPSEIQKEFHDKWKARKQLPQSQVPRKQYQRMVQETRDHERGYDPKVEQEAVRGDRLEMVKELKRLKERKVPPHILRKERSRLIREMETRRLQRQKEREEAFAQSQQQAP